MKLLSGSVSNNGLAKYVSGVEAVKQRYREFYKRFEAVKALYIIDSPKGKGKNERGDLEYIISNERCFLIEDVRICSENDLRENAQVLLRILYENGILSKRRYESLSEKVNVAVKVLKYIPVDLFDKELFRNLTEELKDKEINFEFEKYDIKGNLEKIVNELSRFNIVVNVYALMPDGSISKKAVNNIKTLRNLIKQSILITTNAIGYYGILLSFEGNYIVGLPDQEPRNKYYKMLIEEIRRKRRTIVEPFIERSGTEKALLMYLEKLGYLR